MDPLDVGNLSALALVLLLLGKEALSLLSKRANGNANGYSAEIKTLHELDQQLEHIQQELMEVRAGLANVVMMYHNLELRLSVQERQSLRAENELQILRAMVDRKI